MRVYVAGPLFTPTERDRLRDVAGHVEAAGEDPILPIPREGFTVEEDRPEVYRACVEGVTAADALVAVLDGADADSGVAYEVGYARSRGTPVLGLRADYRTLGPEGPVNTMLAQGVNRLALPASPEEEARAVADFLRDPPSPDRERLTRDKVPQMRRRGDEDVDVTRVEGEDHVRHLKRYLVERAQALVAAEGVEEKDLVSDLLEGVETLMEQRAWSGESIREVKEKREREFGGLDQGYVLGAGTEEGSP